MNIIAYTYEADNHCIDCTKERFNTDHYIKLLVLVDREGNLVNPLFSTDEWQELDESFVAENPTQYLSCGDCHEIIDTYKTHRPANRSKNHGH